MADSGTNGKMTFDEALALNCVEFAGLNPINSATWLHLLTDLAVSLFTWEGNGLDFFDRLLIEKFIHQKKIFCMVKPRYKTKKAIITGQIRIMECVPTEYGMRNNVLRVRLVCDRMPKNMIQEYCDHEFVLFDDFSLTEPQLLTMKYAEILGRLDALYEQNIDKLGVPIIGLCPKTMRNELINVFKRTKMKALFALINDNRNKATELFYDAKIEFLLDKLNAERGAIMKEYLQELGVNPNDEVGEATHYVNTTAIKESSLISKYFSASKNVYRTNFCDKCNKRFIGLNLNYYTTVKTYDEKAVENGEVNQV